MNLPFNLSRSIWTGLLVIAAPVAFSASAEPIRVEPFETPLEQLHQSGACRGCDLQGVDLEGAHLIGVDLRDADLRGARLGGAPRKSASRRSTP